jgi:MFS family permease
MKRSARIQRIEQGSQAVPKGEPVRWNSVGDIAGFPFETFDEMQAAVAARSFNIGVDSFAAAQWVDRFGKRLVKAFVTSLSMLLVLAAIASIVAALVTGEYWLMVAPIIQAVVFYLSHPASPYHKWATVGGAATLPVFINLLLNKWPVAATLVAYAGLTFATVRAAAYVTNSTFRKSLLADEKLFLTAYAEKACTLRNTRTKRVYSA